MQVSVVVPTYNRKALVKRCVESLVRQRYPSDSFEIIVVDDGSSDGTADLLCEAGLGSAVRLLCVSQDHKGPAAARNRGIREAKGEIVAFIDDDCIASETWLDEVTQGYAERRVGGIGGQILPAQSSSIISEYLSYRHAYQYREGELINGELMDCMTGNASYRKDILDRVGGFDERFSFYGCEDTDLGRRVRRCGYRLLYNPRAIVFHHHHNTLTALVHNGYRDGVGWGIFWRKWEPNRSLLCEAGNLLIAFLTVGKLPFTIYSLWRKGVGVKRSCVYALLDKLTFLLLRSVTLSAFCLRREGRRSMGKTG